MELTTITRHPGGRIRAGGCQRGCQKRSKVAVPDPLGGGDLQKLHSVTVGRVGLEPTTGGL